MHTPAQDGDLEKYTATDLLLPGHTPRCLRSAVGAETAGSAARLLATTTHGAFPVVDEQGRFGGTVTRSQLVRPLCTLSTLHGSERGNFGPLRSAAAADAAVSPPARGRRWRC